MKKVIAINNKITVKELIGILKEFQLDLEVGFIDYNGDRYIPATELREVFVTEGGIFGYSDHLYAEKKRQKIVGIHWK